MFFFHALLLLSFFFFFFNDPATTEIYTLSLHDALPISAMTGGARVFSRIWTSLRPPRSLASSFERNRDRKSTRLNSSHVEISYAVFCLKKKKKKKNNRKHNQLCQTHKH